MRKLGICCLAAALLLCGCGAKKTNETPKVHANENGGNVVVLETAPVESQSASHYGVYSLDGGEQENDFGNFDSDTADENALLARDGAVFSVSNGDINKTGDTAGTVYDGMNAAAAALSGAHLLLDACTLTTNGQGASGLYGAGEGTVLTVTDAQIVTAGGNSPALVCMGGAGADIANTRLMAEAADTPLIVTDGSAVIRLSGCTLSSGTAQTVDVRGTLSLTLDAQQLTGGIRLMGEDGKPAHLELQLQKGASFTGVIAADNADAIHIRLDETSTWTLTGEQTVAALTAPDTTFSGIQSAGFNMYYNAELEANAWLNAQAYVLPGGGFLSPLI